MPTEYRLPPLHRRQTEILRDPARFKVAACGRRFGKSRLGVVACLETALTGGVSWWVAPDYPTASIGWRGLTTLARQIPGADIQRGERIVQLPGRGWVQVRSAWEPDSLRGEGLKRVVVDEAALVAEAAWTQALRPALADQHGDALFLFSPKGRNWVYRLYVRGQNATEPQYASWNLPSSDNPFLDASEIAQARQDMPERWFRQEFLAEFLDDSGGVFRGVRSNIVLDREPDGPVFVGVDLGRTTDATVFTALCGGHVLAQDRFTDTGWEVQFGRLHAFCARHQPRLVLIETNFNDMFAERAARELSTQVEGFRTTAQSKRDLIDALALGIETGEVTYPELPQLVNELEAFEYRQAPSGQVRMAAPLGVHDDCVISLALAHWAATRIGYGYGSMTAAQAALERAAARQADPQRADDRRPLVELRW